jgi:hypothetical protein
VAVACESREPALAGLQQACLALEGDNLDAEVAFLPLERADLTGVGDPVWLAAIAGLREQALADCDVWRLVPPHTFAAGVRPLGATCNTFLDCQSMVCEPRAESPALAARGVLKYPIDATDCDGLGCAPRPPEGGGCRHLGECPADTYCTGVGGNLGTCLRLPAVGEACVSGRCGAGAVCNSEDRCALRGALNQACSRTASGADTCGGTYVCVGGICQAGATEASACDAQTSPCARGLRCAEGTCRRIRRGGEGCAADADCLSGYTCTESVCTPWPTIGQSGCDDQRPCATGRCDGGQCRLAEVDEPCTRRSVLSPELGCAAGLVCYNGMCSAPTAAGAPCESNTECGFNSRCGTPTTTMTCTPRQPRFEPCASDSDCEVGLFCRGEPGLQLCTLCPLD